MKSYTDLEQSKELAKILPLESADMFFSGGTYPKELHLPTFSKTSIKDNIPCWSLAALLDVLPDGTDVVKDKADTENEKYMCTIGIKYDIISTFGNNPVDACYEIIIRLHKLNLL